MKKTVEIATVGERLQYARGLIGYSQQKIADHLGVTQRTVVNWEQLTDEEWQGRTPKLSILQEWAAMTRVRVNWLKEGVGDPLPTSMGGDPSTFGSPASRLQNEPELQEASRHVSYKLVDGEGNVALQVTILVEVGETKKVTLEAPGG